MFGFGFRSFEPGTDGHGLHRSEAFFSLFSLFAVNLLCRLIPHAERTGPVAMHCPVLAACVDSRWEETHSEKFFRFS